MRGLSQGLINQSIKQYDFLSYSCSVEKGTKKKYNQDVIANANTNAVQEKVSLFLFIESTKHELASWFDNPVDKLCLLSIYNR